jgi:exonuclease SbcC
MRILNIFFKNINSLEGEGRVYFDQGPIADSGVFAITGPNGSGKTSILDVITLGLYGETFRFDKPAEHVMTKQTSECFAQVEFALGAEKFRSSWSIKAGNNAASGPQMSLQRLDDQAQLLAETPAQVRSRVAELTGMDFHKFSKSIVLPQGDFAAFLNALDSERLDILEKISGTDIYGEYRQQAESNHSQLQARCAQLQQDIASLPLMNQETLEGLELDLQDFQAQWSELKQQQQQVQAQLTNWQNHAERGKQQQQLERRRQDLLTQLGRDRQDLETIDASQATNGYRDDLAMLDNKRAQLEQHRQALENYRRELAVLQQQLGNEVGNLPANTSLAEQQQSIDSLKLSISELKLELPRQTELAQSIQQQLADNRATAIEADQWLQAHQNDAVLLTEFPEIARLRNLRIELAELAGKQKVQTNWSKNTSAALKKNRDLLELTTSELSSLQQQIIDDDKTLVEIAQGKNFEELKDVLLDQQTRVNDFQEMCELAELTNRLSNKGWFSWFGGGNKQQELPDESELQVRMEQLQQEKSREENIIQVLEQAIRNEAMIKKMSADRARLIEGQPCYLCGSIQHPYVTKPPLYNDAKKALVDQRGKIQVLKSHIDSVSSQLKAVQKTSSLMTAKQAKLQQIRAKWTLLANRHALLRDGMAIGNLSLQKQLLKEELDELNRISALVKQHAQLQRNIAKAKIDIERKQALLETVTQKVAELENTWNSRPPEFTEAEQRFATSQSEEKALIAKLEAQLTALGEKLPSKGKENPLFDRLNNRRQEYQVYALRKSALQDETQALNAKLQDCQSTIIAYQQRQTSSLEALREQERVGLHLTVVEKQKLIVDADHQLRVSQIEFDAIGNSLNEKLASSAFSNQDGLREVLQLIEQAPAIEQRYLADKAKLESLEKQLAEVVDSYHAELADLENIDEAAVQQELRSLLERTDIAEQEIRSQQNKLDKQQQYRERYLALRDQLDEQQVLADQATAELALINDERGGFRLRIQQLMIDKLLTHTNRMLEKLSGRYYVRGVASDNGLALEIEDTKQKNLRRLPQTLSGGESFVVSLALALALAEVANNGRAIDSLFLDEGFGNLDAESMYLAMSTLEGLKTQGKTVGVISHVDGVKKRIKTQIELVKKANGLSELKMVA